MKVIIRRAPPDPKNMTNEQYIDAARSQYQHEGSVEIDDGAKVSRGSDNGGYVQAWVWVADSNLPDDMGSADDSRRP